MVTAGNRNRKQSVRKVYRKTIDAELTSGTSFDGVQPGDVVAMRLYGSKDQIKPVFIMDMNADTNGNLTAIIVTKDSGIKTISERDVQSMKLYGNQNAPVINQLRQKQAEWLKTRKTIEAVMKQIAPLLATRAKAKMRLDSLDKELRHGLDSF